MTTTNLYESLPDFQRDALDKFLRAVQDGKLDGSTQSWDSQNTQVLVFGSYAADRARPWSDLDVAVVSDAFVGIPWLERIRQLNQIVGTICRSFHPVGVTKKELESHQYPSILRTIRKKHLRVR